MTAFLANDRTLNAKIESLNDYLKNLRSQFPGARLGHPRISTIVERDWINQWRETVAPTKVSKKFWVVPEWQKGPPPKKRPGELVITMEPGLAFGTGFHATTQLCLEMIEQLVPEKAKVVLDYGAGTAILAMAAALLGAKKTVAIDSDQLSVRVAKDNIAYNKLESRIQVIIAGKATAKRISPFNFDLVAANLFAGELLRLRFYIKRHLKKKGCLIAGGILTAQAKEVIAGYQKAGFSLVRKKERQGWVALLMKKK